MTRVSSEQIVRLETDDVAKVASLFPWGQVEEELPWIEQRLEDRGLG
jgi:hypothetical protein